MNRRAFSKTFLEGLGSYALIRTLVENELLGGTVRPATESWVAGLNEMSRDLRSNLISPSDWQDRVRELFNRVSYSDLVTAIDFDRLAEGFPFPDVGVNVRTIKFPQLAGLPDGTWFHSKIFGMKRDRAIIPHAHRNMVSCHYVLAGELWLTHYNKVEEDKTHIVIEPSVEVKAEPGSHSSISDERNNVHWLRSLTETAFTLDVIVLDLQGRDWQVQNIDPEGADKIAGGRLRAPKLDVADALRKYGHQRSHH